MIKTETAYKKSLEKLQEDKLFIRDQKKALEDMGLTEEQVVKALQPSITFHEQLKEEVVYYERIRRGEFEPIINLHNLGKSLIAISDLRRSKPARTCRSLRRIRFPSVEG